MSKVTDKVRFTMSANDFYLYFESHAIIRAEN